MKNGVPQHPEAHVMAAFVDGTLAPSDVAGVAAHLRECNECRVVVAETARFEREEATPRRSSQWIAIAAAVLLVAIIVPFVLRSRSPMQQLIAASPRDHRTIDARLSGFNWARLAAPARGTQRPDPSDLKLAGAAGDVLEKSKDPHAIGVAYLLTQQRTDAIATLERAATHSNDARVWNDLAAARYTFAIRNDHPSQLPEALADADHALRIDPKLAEGLFNRALIIEAIGLREQARKAWQQYLEIDGGSGWAVEAREHLRNLDAPSRVFDRKFLDELPPQQLAREFPQEARSWAEYLLGEWSESQDEKKLARIREIANALSDHMLRDSVRAIDTSDERTRTILLDAQRTYHKARRAYNNHSVADSEAGFQRAHELFTSGNSPMAKVAAYYAATAAFDQDKGAMARTELARLLNGVDPSQYPAIAAQIRWSLAVEANSAGDWGTAVREADRAATAFRGLGEAANAAILDNVAAYALELIGDDDDAWRRRVRALRTLCPSDSRCADMLQGAANTLAVVDRDAAAVSIIDLIDGADAKADAATIAARRIKRARALRRTGDMRETARSLDDARRAAAGIHDEALRNSIEAQIAVEDAPLTKNRAEINRALSFLESHELRHLIPYALAQDARVLRANGDYDLAIETYAASVAASARQGLQIESTRGVVDESIELALQHGATADAFALAGGGGIRRAPDGAAILEYAVLPQATAIFCMSRNGLAVTTAAIGRKELRALVDPLADAIRARAPVADIDRQAAALYRYLIAPVRAELNGFQDVVIIGDRALNGVPFAALYDDRTHRYLIEDFNIRFASGPPSEQPATLAPAIVIANPTVAGEPPLPASVGEAESIAHLYDAAMISGSDATPQTFVEMLPKYALIHYSGHADSDVLSSYAALRLAGDPGLLSAADIAKLSLPLRPLVVLAACGTFRGNATHAGGMASIARAFIAAGARGVVGTLWEIDDDVSAPLFLRFHQSLRAGASPARALREAQVDMLHSADARLGHPATWAPAELLSTF